MKKEQVDNMNYLMKNKDRILSGNEGQSIENNENSSQDPPDANNESTTAVPVMELIQLVQISTESAQQRHGVVLVMHVGLFSSEQDRIRKVDEMEEERINRSNVKKRKVGIKPQFAYQAGDSVSYGMLHQLMRAYGKYNDTVTMDSEKGNTKPRNIAVLMVLNEVSETSMNGGGPREYACAKRDKPEFLLFSNNKQDCKKVMSAFSDIHTTNAQKNKKEKYNHHWFQQNEETRSILPCIDDHIKARKKQRENGTSKRIVTLETIQEETSEDLCRTLD